MGRERVHTGLLGHCDVRLGAWSPPFLLLLGSVLGRPAAAKYIVRERFHAPSPCSLAAHRAAHAYADPLGWRARCDLTAHAGASSPQAKGDQLFFLQSPVRVNEWCINCEWEVLQLRRCQAGTARERRKGKQRKTKRNAGEEETREKEKKRCERVGGASRAQLQTAFAQEGCA